MRKYCLKLVPHVNYNTLKKLILYIIYVLIKNVILKKMVMAAIWIMHKRDHGNYTSKSGIAHLFLPKSKN